MNPRCTPSSGKNSETTIYPIFPSLPKRGDTGVSSRALKNEKPTPASPASPAVGRSSECISLLMLVEASFHTPKILKKTRTPFYRDSGFRYNLKPITYHLLLVHVTAVPAARGHRRGLFLLWFICYQSFCGNQ